MWKRTKQDERKQLREIMINTKQEVDYGDNISRDIAPVDNRSLRKVKKKRKQIEREIDLVERPPSRIAMFLKMSFGSSFIILGIFGIPITIGLLIMLATIPDVITTDLGILPSTIITVGIISVVLLFLQSVVISAIMVFMLRISDLRIGTLVTGVVSIGSILFLLNYLLPLFQNRVYFM